MSSHGQQIKRAEVINAAAALVAGSGQHNTPRLREALSLIVLGYLKPSGTEFSCKSRGTDATYTCSSSACECLAYTHRQMCVHMVAAHLWCQSVDSLAK